MQPNTNLVNRNNYFLVEEFLDWLQSKRKRSNTIRRYRSWLNHLLIWAMEIPLKQAHKIKPTFADYVREKKLAAESEKKIVETARAFLKWAKLHKAKEFVSMPAYWIEDSLTPVKPVQKRITEFVSCEYVSKIISRPAGKENIALWRDQAMASLLFLSGARADAAVTLPIRAVHLNDTYPNIEQDPLLGVHTKIDKSAKTFLHHVPELLDIVCGWDEFVRLNYPETHPWYVPIHQEWGEQTTRLLTPGKNRSAALRKRLHLVTNLFDLPYKSPHQYRHGYAHYGLARCNTMAEYHALSRNMMHESVAITDKIYVQLEEAERGKTLANLRHNSMGQFDSEFAAFIAGYGKDDLVTALQIIGKMLARS